MKKQLLINLMLIAFTITTVTAVHAGATSPKAHLESLYKKMEKLADNTTKNEKKILKIVNNLMDFQEICKSSLGKHWDARNDKERKEFVDTLHALIEKNLINNLDSNKEHKISYDTESVAGNKATVITVVTLGDGPRAEETEIAYKMKKKGKKWVVIDMVTDGVSLVSNYRSQFNKIIAEDGWDALLKKMKDKLSDQK